MFNYSWCFTYEYIRNEQHISSGKALMKSAWQLGHTGLLFQFWWATKPRKWEYSTCNKRVTESNSESSCTNQLWHTARCIPSYKSHTKHQKKVPGVALLFLSHHFSFPPFLISFELVTAWTYSTLYSMNLFHPPPVSGQHMRECQNPVLGFILLYKH